jgi:serine/threonine-protein kinase RsbW
MPEEHRLEYSLQAQLESLGEVRAYIDRKGQALGLDKQLLGDLRLVVDEAVTNIIIHGYQGQGGPVELELSLQANDVIVRIRDQAPAFDPEGVADPALNTALAERQPGGMGIFLMKQMMDTVAFSPLAGGGNELRLVKHSK